MTTQTIKSPLLGTLTVTMSKNSTLDNFSSIESTSTANTKPNTPTERDKDNYSIEDYDLPDDVPLSDTTSLINNVAITVPNSDTVEVDVSMSSRAHRFTANQMGYVLEGTEDMKLKSDRVERIYPPSKYSKFEDFDPVYAHPTTSFSSGRWGAWGISSERLEAAIRLVTGGGQYRAENLNITVLDFRGCWLVEYKGDAYIFAYEKVGHPPETIATEEVNGIEIKNEVDETVLSGVKAMMDILPQFGIEIIDLKERDSNSLVFTTNHDKPVRFTGGELCRFISPNTNDKYEGTHTIETRHTNETYEYTWAPEDTKYNPPEVVREDKDNSRKRIILGYTKSENRIEHGLRPNKYGVGKRVLATPWHLEISFNKYERRISTRITRSNSSEIIAEIPFNSPDHPNPDELEEIQMWDPKNNTSNR